MKPALSTLDCPHCGAPVSARMGDGAVCRYCMRSLVGVPEASWAALIADDGALDDEEAGGGVTCRVAGRGYLLRGLLGTGAHADVFFAERRRRPSELVVLKVARGDDAAPLAREWSVLVRLLTDDSDGAPFFTTLLPQPVQRGVLTARTTRARPACVYRWRSGFVHTLLDVACAYPDGVDPRAAIWMWRRILEVLGWAHRRGVSHRAVLAEHVLVHARDHRVQLVGWSAATDEVARAGEDLAMSARVILDVCKGRAPKPLVDLLDAALRGAGEGDAWALSRAVAEAAAASFGPPRFHPFTMPGWR